MLTEEQIRRSFSVMATLARGWNGYDAEAPSMAAMAAAMWFVGEMLADEVPIDRVAPSAVGGVGVTIWRDGLRAYVEFPNDTPYRFCLLLDYGDGEEPHVFTLGAEPDAFRKAPKWIKGFFAGE